MTMLQEIKKKKKKIEEKNRVLESAIKLPNARDDDLLRQNIFPYKGSAFRTKEKESEEEKKTS